MSDFFPGVTVLELIAGDSGVLYDVSRQLGRLGGGLGDAVSELSSIDAGHWKGIAANAFRGVIHQQPLKYETAATSFQSAARAVVSYAQDLELAQGVVARAITSWESGNALTLTWEAAKTSGAPVQPMDPGLAARMNAESLLSGARSVVDRAAGIIVAAVDVAAERAPQRPTLFDDLQRFAGDVAKAEIGVAYFASGMNFHADLQFIEGIGDGTWGMIMGIVQVGKAAWDVSPARMLLDPKGWYNSVEHTITTVATVGEYAIHHPAQFSETVGSNLINLHQWETDPAKAFGELVPSIVLAVASAGVGFAADTMGETGDVLATISDSVAGSVPTLVDAGTGASTVSAVSDLATTLRDGASAYYSIEGNLETTGSILDAFGYMGSGQAIVESLDVRQGNSGTADETLPVDIAGQLL